MLLWKSMQDNEQGISRRGRKPVWCIPAVFMSHKMPVQEWRLFHSEWTASILALSIQVSHDVCCLLARQDSRFRSLWKDSLYCMSRFFSHKVWIVELVNYTSYLKKKLIYLNNLQEISWMKFRKLLEGNYRITWTNWRITSKTRFIWNDLHINKPSWFWMVHMN